MNGLNVWWNFEAKYSKPKTHGQPAWCPAEQPTTKRIWKVGTTSTMKHLMLGQSYQPEGPFEQPDLFMGWLSIGWFSPNLYEWEMVGNHHFHPFPSIHFKTRRLGFQVIIIGKPFVSWSFCFFDKSKLSSPPVTLLFQPNWTICPSNWIIMAGQPPPGPRTPCRKSRPYDQGSLIIGFPS